MRITISSVEHITGDYGEYIKVTGIDDKGKEVFKNASEKFRDKWDLLKEGNSVDFKMVQRNNKWQVGDITLAEAQQAPSSTRPTSKQTISGEERGMWWKEIGELIRSDKLEEVFGEKDAPFIRKAYKLQAIASLGITAKKED